MQAKKSTTPKIFIDNLDKVLALRNIKAVDLHRNYGFANSTISRWREGSLPSRATLKLLADSLEVNPHWLLTGEGHMEINVLREEKVSPTASEATSVQRVNDYSQTAEGWEKDTKKPATEGGPMEPERRVAIPLSFAVRLAEEHPRAFYHQLVLYSNEGKHREAQALARLMLEIMSRELREEHGSALPASSAPRIREESTTGKESHAAEAPLPPRIEKEEDGS